MTEKVTEKESNYNSLESMSVYELLSSINNEDKSVPEAVEKVLHRIETVVILITEKLRIGGRLFYLGAGTSGRLGIVDASELPPTFGLEHGKVIGLIAGGDQAIRKEVEFAEDDEEGAWRDLNTYDISSKDIVIGIAASGSTPYVVGGLKACKLNGITTGAITCNPDAPVSEVSDFPVAVVVGPEFVTGSTRMKAGTAQKLVLNMITTSVMIKLGRVKGNKMVDMQLSNNKLIDRGTRMIMNALNIDFDTAKALLHQYGTVRLAIDNYKG